MNTSSDPHSPYTVYKSDLSYFSGKLEVYLRYKNISHQPQNMDVKSPYQHIIRTGRRAGHSACRWYSYLGHER